MTARRTITSAKTLQRILFGLLLAGALQGPNTARAQQSLQDFRTIDFVYAQDPQLFHDLFQLAQSQTVRIAILGDSQESSPTSQGYVYFPRLNYEMWKRYGNIPETPIEGCFDYNTTTPPADWLMSGNCTTPGPQTSRLSSNQILPNVTPKAFTSANHGQLAMLQQDAIDVHARAQIPNTVDYFDTSGVVKARIFAATNASSGEVLYRTRPSTSHVPSYSASIAASGTLALALESPTFGVLAADTPQLVFNGSRYMQLEVLGTDAVKLTDIIGLRFFNESNPKGVVFDTLSHAGYKATDLLSSHGNAGAMFKAFGFHAAVIHYGANESGVVTADTFRTNIQSVITMVRGWVNDPNFPIILIADVYQDGRTSSQAAQYDKYTGAELAIAQADSKVMVINARRLMEDIGWNGTSGKISQFVVSDGIHYTPLGAQLLAAAEAAAMMNEVHVTGCMTDPGNVAFSEAATLSIDLDGVTSCPDLGQFAVSGALALDHASLNVALTNGFSPTLGQQFKLLSFGSVTGTFGTLTLPALGSGLTWNTSALYSTGTISVATAPPAAPTISITSGGDQAVTAPAVPAPIAFQLTGSGNLTITASSNNQTLLPDSAITLSSGCGTSVLACTATLGVVSGQTGSAVISLRATDTDGQFDVTNASLQVNAAPAGGGTGGGSGTGSGSGSGTGTGTGTGTGGSGDAAAGTTKSGGGGAVDLVFLLGLVGIGACRFHPRRREHSHHR